MVANHFYLLSLPLATILLVAHGLSFPSPPLLVRTRIQRPEKTLGMSKLSSTTTIPLQVSISNVTDTVGGSTPPTQSPSPYCVPTQPQQPAWMDVMKSLALGSDREEQSSSSEQSTMLAKDREYQRGLVTICLITLLFASNSPVLHAVFAADGTHDGMIVAPPVLFLNAAVSIVALVGLVLGGERWESHTALPSSMASPKPSHRQPQQRDEPDRRMTLQAGCELGIWKFMGTTANLYGLALTTAGHGALLIQLTTLIVPVVQGLQGVPIPRRIQASVALALAGVVCFTQDSTGSPSAVGDALCVLAAIFYATYDLRLFVWGKRVGPRTLITTKIATQAALSTILLGCLGRQDMLDYVAASTPETWTMILPVVLWSGIAVNAIAPLWQVGGQQVVGPTRCQTIYASQPLWAALLSFFFLGETMGMPGLVGGSAFLVALFLAATADAPDDDCGQTNCEI